MRICYVVQRYLPAKLSGSEYFIVQIAERMSRLGHQVTVITSDCALAVSWFNPLVQSILHPSVETINGVKVIRLSVQWYRAAYWYVLKLLPGFSRKQKDFLQVKSFGPYLSQIVRVLRDNPADIVHAVSFPCSYLLQLAPKHFSAKYFLTPFYHAALFRDQKHAALSYLCQKTSGIMACTNFEKKALRKNIPTDSNIKVIPLGIELGQIAGADSNRFRRKYQLGKKFVVLFVGTKGYDKGALANFEAVRILSEGKFHDKIALVAAGPATPGWTILKAKYKGDWLVDIPYLDGKEKFDAYLASNVFSMVSRSDAFGLVYLESWLAKKPVIGSFSGATPEVIRNGVDGQLVPFQGVNTLMEKIAFYLEHPQIAQQHGLAGYQMVRSKYSWDKIVPELIEFYRN